MEKIDKNLKALAGWVIACLLPVLMTISANVVADDESVCELEAVDASFKALKKSKDKDKRLVNKKNTTLYQSRLKASGYLTGHVDGLLGPETDHALTLLCRKLELKKLINLEESAEPDTPEAPKSPENDDQPDPTALARQIITGLQETLVDANQQNEIQLDGDDCGCSRDFAAKVYGFYPAWLADGKTRKIDFSLLDRIGVHALLLDSNGQISNPRLWDKDSGSESDIAKFLNNAHRYRVKVDVSYYMSDWLIWNTDQLKQAVNSIATSASQKFRNHRSEEDILAYIGKQLRKFLPFIEDNSAVSVNGINLYFDHYNNRQADVAKPWLKIEEIVNRLNRKLRKNDVQVKINLILGLDWAGIDSADSVTPRGDVKFIDIGLFTNLGNILLGKPISDDDTNPANIDNLFVFLPQKHSSKAKKLIRRTIEDAFSGEERRTVLRKTMPIISTWPQAVGEEYFNKVSNKKPGQFIDDLIYLQDNFAGIGLWPLPLASKAKEEVAPVFVNSRDISSRLEQVYEVGGGSGSLGEKLCNFACPNRWLFRLAFDFLAVMLVIYGLLAIGYCRLREIYQEKFPYFVSYGTVTALIFTVSLVCDPFWQEISNYVLVGIVIALVGGLGVRQVRKSIQPNYP